jgi:Ca2+:H+ antiporter
MKLNYLLIFLPIAIVLRVFGASPILVFAASALAVMPLAELMGDATEALSRYLGATAGSLLNATLNNAPEIIIAFFALKNGLVDVVKASLTGSILGNLLFGMGLAMYLGGLKHREQRFGARLASMNANLLTLAVFGLIIPAVFHFGSEGVRREISLAISILLLVVYAASLIHIMIAPQSASPTSLGDARAKDLARPQAARRDWKGPLGILVLVTLGLAVMSEIMTDALEPTAERLGFTPIFAGIILLAMVSNIPQFYNAIGFARSDQMDLVMGVTLGASTQVALLVAPLLVLLGMLLGQPMDLLFTPVEILAIVLAVFVVRNITTDGESNWLEGLMLLVVYLMLAFGFYFLPASVVPVS